MPNSGELLPHPKAEDHQELRRETPANVTLAEKIFGPDIAALKGKSTRPKPKRVKEDLVEIPQELKEQHKELALCIDIMCTSTACHS